MAYSCQRKIVKAYSEDLRWRVLYQTHLRGLSAEEIADNLFVSKRWIKEIRRLYSTTGKVSRSPRKGTCSIMTGE